MFDPDPTERVDSVSDPVPTSPVTPAGPPGFVAPEPGPMALEPTAAASGPPRVGWRPVLAAAVLSAVLASGGTFAVLDATGSLNPRVAAGSSGNPVASHETVTVDESSAVIDVAAKAGPAVVRITESGQTTDQVGGTIPESGVGSGIIFDPAGW